MILIGIQHFIDLGLACFELVLCLSRAPTTPEPELHTIPHSSTHLRILWINCARFYRPKCVIICKQSMNIYEIISPVLSWMFSKCVCTHVTWLDFLILKVNSKVKSKKKNPQWSICVSCIQRYLTFQSMILWLCSYYLKAVFHPFPFHPKFHPLKIQLRACDRSHDLMTYVSE